MYQSPNLSCRISNENIDNLLGVMETDFLNFHDEEHFGTALYQNELLDDSQSSLLDIVGDDYTRQNSSEYVDHSVIWEQDIEREINGDVAVIPMSGQINTFPKLSNSPPSKDFQKIFSDWQHLTAIETAPSEDLTSDLALQNQGIVVDMLDYLPPVSLPQIAPELPVEQPKIITPTSTVIPTFDFSTTTIPKLEPTPEKIPKPEIKPPIRKTGGKNLELLKQVVKEEIDLDSSFKSEVTSSDELDSANDNFDITSYVNGDDDLLMQTDNKFDVKPVIPTKNKPENRNFNRKYGGCYEKNMPLSDSDEEEKETVIKESKKPIKIKKEIKQEIIEKQEDSEEESIDVETVSEQMPVLQARDVDSLWEQFEANEAANPQPPQNLFEEKPQTQTDLKPLNLNVSTNSKTTSLIDNSQIISNPKSKQAFNDKPKIKQLNPELKQPTTTKLTKNMQEQVPMELIQKIKASGTKKSISVIPAMPSKKPRGTRLQDAAAQLNRNKLLKIMSPTCNNESVQLDHDYCTVSPIKNNSRRSSSDSDINIKKFSPPDHSLIKKCDKTEQKTQKSSDNINEIKKNLGTVIDDTAIRIGKQIKNAINNENALKQKLIMCRNQDALKNQPTIKNGDGKVMISLLKSNVRNTNILNKGNTIVNTTNANDEQIQNIIVNDISDDTQRNAKKRKLNLEEYKKLRGDIIKTNSCENSRTNSPRNSGSNSPMPGETQKEEKYQELIMKMASEILKTNAKAKQTTSETKLEEFVPPEIKKSPKTEIKPDETTEKNSKDVKPLKENYEIRTYVSIGINTENSFLQKQVIPEPKIAFKLLKKKELQRNKFFDSKSSESEDNASPIKDPNVDKTKLSQIITPILQNASGKINSNSLITNITATLLQQSPKIAQENISKLDKQDVKEEPTEHGEDKTVIIINKDKEKPEMKSKEVQTEEETKEEVPKEKVVRQYRTRRDSSASSSASVSSLKTKPINNIIRKTTSQNRNHHNSSSNSVSSSLGSRWSRSRSRSRSRSSSRSEYSSYSSGSSRSRSRSRSVSPPRRWHSDRNSRSRHRYNRSRRRSRSNSYRGGNYRHSRSPYSRSRSRRRRERESAERERMREVEERRVIYVGKISDDITKADLRRRFQSFGPITNVSVHFRDHGDNYGFVTFQHKMDAYEAVERGNDDPNLPKYDISFGGRRAFCKTRYSDLDNIDDDNFNSTSIFRREEDSFDILLREVQAKLRKRKV